MANAPRNRTARTKSGATKKKKTEQTPPASSAPDTRDQDDLEDDFDAFDDYDDFDELSELQALSALEAEAEAAAQAAAAAKRAFLERHARRAPNAPNSKGGAKGGKRSQPASGPYEPDNVLDMLSRVFDEMSANDWDPEKFEDMTQGVGMVLGSGPAFAALGSMLSNTTAQSSVLMNATQMQRQLDQVGLCTTSACVKQLLSMNDTYEAD